MWVGPHHSGMTDSVPAVAHAVGGAADLAGMSMWAP